MKKILVSLLGAFIIFGVSGMANASLIDLGIGVIQDDRGTGDTGDDLFWLKDLEIFDNKTYAQQITDIANYSFTTGNNDVWEEWHMANRDIMVTLWSNYSADEIGSFFLPSRVTETGIMIEGRYDEIFNDPNLPPYHNNFITMYSYNLGYWFTGGGAIDDTSNRDGMSAWVYTEIDPRSGSPVPEPAAMTLLGIGLLGIAGVSRKKN